MKNAEQLFLDDPRADAVLAKTHSADVAVLLPSIKLRHGDRITGELIMPAREGAYAEFPTDLEPRLAAALRSQGIRRLYSHQLAAWNAIRVGQHTVVVTPTASGKTLCYNLPVLQAVINAQAKALYLFPTKALAQDQVAELLELNTAGRLGVRAFTFDGDTPGDARQAVRTRGDIVVSNPDMLHQGILPHHTKWAQFFENLRYVVIDELHTYRGVFGSHMANVIRRLRRVCRFYRSEPLFICCSATIANPAELASQLVGEAVTAITESGAPQGEKHLLLWNPPVINADLGLRASARSQTTRIARSAIKAGLKTIIFANSRLMVEVLTKYLKDVFDHDPRRPARVAAYRGGYLPTERRATEAKLRAGSLDCVVATNALELGVDIGALDVCILNGYPGTIAGTWQRLGRAGRRNRTSLGVLVATSEPLDQYIVRNPAFFTGASPEHARVAPDQLLILMDHVRCAAFELPFTADETFGGENLVEMLSHLEEQGVLHREGNRWHWMADSYPASSVSLRSVADGNFVVVDITGGKQEVIAEVDYSSAALTLYEGAIYMIQASPWQVERLDWKGRKAFATKTNADYYTDAVDYTRLKILDRFEDSPRATSLCARGEVHVVRRVAGYKKIRYYSHENVGFGPVNLPDHEMHTSAVWWQVDPAALHQAFANRWQALDGFLGAAYAIHSVAVLLTMSDRHDLGRAIGDGEGQWFAITDAEGRGKLQGASGEGIEIDVAKEFIPTLFLYDNYPGGIGLSVPLYDLRDEVIAGARALVSACECRWGCPACVGPILATDEVGNRSPKIAALRALDLFAERKA
ncbi:MAG: DEAD/DEAH box helicase [Betaproteobacteria bacterium]|nr:MAG: DEAD/DEAH box helicase [Betaproteobacteria bacterium]